MSFPWTEEQIERTKAHWADGFSAAAIARILGGGVTRNAVIGKLQRLKVPPRLRATRRRRVYGPRRHRSAAAPKPLAIRPAAVQRFQDKPGVAAFPVSLNIPLMEITDKQCKWAPGEPMDGFCGHRNWGKTPYCQHHARLSYTPEGLRRLGL